MKKKDKQRYVGLLNYREWSPEIQRSCVGSICKALEEASIAFMRDCKAPPLRQITLFPGVDTEALFAVYVAKEVEIEMLRTELLNIKAKTPEEQVNEVHRT